MVHGINDIKAMNEKASKEQSTKSQEEHVVISLKAYNCLCDLLVQLSTTGQDVTLFEDFTLEIAKSNPWLLKQNKLRQFHITES